MHKLAAKLHKKQQSSPSTVPLKNAETTPPNLDDGHREGSFFIDQLIVSPAGDICLIGWIDDELTEFSGFDVRIGKEAFLIQPEEITRWSRPDVAQHLRSQSTNINKFGAAWIGKFENKPGICNQGHLKARFRLHNPESTVKVISMSEQRFLEYFLQFLPDKEQLGIDKRLFSNSFTRIRSCVIDLWHRQRDSQSIKSDHVFGDAPEDPEFAAITVLYGDAGPVALQSMLLYGKVPCGKVEIIYVNNSPEITDYVHREADLFHQTTGHTVRVITLTENIGFGAANDVAASRCEANVIAFINPDVFDVSGNWYRILASYKGKLPAPVCGAVLSYADGAIMHDGMDIVTDPATLDSYEGMPSQLLTAEHFSKGSPRWTLSPEKYRTAPAVSGAFICTTREVHEAVGGFDKDYVFGHYEDADYCLRAWASGYQVCVLRDLALVHLEGKGSKSKPYHRGGRLVNRCTFTERWYREIDSIRKLAENATEATIISLAQ